ALLARIVRRVEVGGDRDAGRVVVAARDLAVEVEPSGRGPGRSRDLHGREHVAARHRRVPLGATPGRSPTREHHTESKLLPVHPDRLLRTTNAPGERAPEDRRACNTPLNPRSRQRPEYTQGPPPA